MMIREPSFCRPEAFHFFASQLPVIDTTDGLLRAAVAVSMHEMVEVDPEAINDRLTGLAKRVLARIRNRSVQAILAHLHDVLFEEEGFLGNLDDYYIPSNSYLPFVLDSHRGIPITLSLVYKVVAERAGLGVVGVNSPGHFLVRVRDESKWMIIDPFSGGDVLTTMEAYERIEKLTGRTIPRAPRYLPTATHSEWISRLLSNLQQVFTTQQNRDDLEAMNELQSLCRESAF